MYSGGTIGVAGGIMAFQLAPVLKLPSSIPASMVGVVVVLVVYLLTYIRSGIHASSQD